MGMVIVKLRFRCCTLNRAVITLLATNVPIWCASNSEHDQGSRDTGNL
jgi:hypothetical protein